MKKRQSNEKKEGRGNIELFGRQICARTDFLTRTFFSYFPPDKFLHSSINLLRLGVDDISMKNYRKPINHFFSEIIGNLSISKNRNFEISEKLSISENASNFSRKLIFVLFHN